MPSTALVFIPAPTGNPQSKTGTDSGASTLIAHLLSKHPHLETSPYTLEHKFLVDTSSVLHPSGSRKVTHFLTLPHQLAGSTFVGSGIASQEAPKGSEKTPQALSLAVIPSQPDTLFPLMVEKMKPLWLPRQVHRIENGLALELHDWRVRIGDLRLSGGQGQWRTRGCLCELEFLGGVASTNEISQMARAFVGALAWGSEFGTVGMKTISSFDGGDSPLVRQYMKLLAFPKT